MKAIMVIGILAILLLAGCAQQVAQIVPESEKKGSAVLHQIEISGSAISPRDLTIDLVDVVEWINLGEDEQKLIFHDGESPKLETGDRYIRAYSSKGTYEYSLMSGAIGTITVE